MHAGAQASGVAFGNTGNQVGGPGQGQGAGKAADDNGDLPLQPEGHHGLVDRPLVEAAPRHADVLARRIAGKGDLALAERVACRAPRQ